MTPDSDANAIVRGLYDSSSVHTGKELTMVNGWVSAATGRSVNSRRERFAR